MENKRKGARKQGWRGNRKVSTMVERKGLKGIYTKCGPPVHTIGGYVFSTLSVSEKN